MSKFTPGPWKLDYDNDTGPNDDYLEEWFVAGPARVMIRHNQTESQANAFLIAAAPELLEALKYFEDEAISSCPAEFVSYECAEKFAAMVSLAIAKAEGREERNE